MVRGDNSNIDVRVVTESGEILVRAETKSCGSASDYYNAPRVYADRGSEPFFPLNAGASVTGEEIRHGLQNPNRRNEPGLISANRGRKGFSL
jgi:hypothetical protein